MNCRERLNGWKSLVYAIALGPVFLFFFLKDYEKDSPAVKFLVWLPFALIAVFAYLSFSLSFNPLWTGLLYGFLLTTLFGVFFFFRLALDSKKESEASRPARKELNFSRGIAWMFFSGGVFLSFSIVAQALCFWLFGEYVTVYFSSEGNIFSLWFFFGLIFGFLYGIQQGKCYMDTDAASFFKSWLLIFLLILGQGAAVLLLVEYPLQRLSPVSYFPQTPEFFFYGLFSLAILASFIFFVPKVSAFGLGKAVRMVFLSLPVLIVHVLVFTGYSITVNLTAASILEGGGKHSVAGKLYARVVPYISYDPLLASLNHRQGVLNVLNKDYESALSFFKKVMAGYSEEFEVYQKARKYVKSFEKNKAMEDRGSKIFSVRHRTFLQAASCFPNSLAVILGFYESETVSARDLSYSIKESFDEGTFIWKAESFLKENGYTLLTAFWQSRETLIALLEVGYPVLIYLPGHVYTLYGYDENLEMFFTYDTAKSNQWDDKPFSELQMAWMNKNFLMSVVIKKGKEEELRRLLPGLFSSAKIYRLWQKRQISRYYESGSYYWPDYDRNRFSEEIGPEGLKLSDHSFQTNGFHPYSWDPEKWTKEIFPQLNESWAVDWRTFERMLLYLLHHGETEEALKLIRIYQTHLDQEFFNVFNRFLILKLAAEAAAGNGEEVLSVSDKLIGAKSAGDSSPYWGYYFKGRHLMKKGDLNGASRLLLPILDDLDIGSGPPAAAFGQILGILSEIYRREPGLVDTDKAFLLKMGRIRYGMRPEGE